MKLSKPAATASGAGLALILLAVAGWLVFRTPAGPLHSITAGGRPVVDEGGGRARPGQDITATAFVVNSSDDPVTLLSASLVPVPGQRAGKLAHVAVDTSLSIIGSGRNWPPPGLPIKPLPGARIGHGQANIVFGITGSGPGFWSAAGLKITYRWPGSAYSVIAWSVDGACIRIHDCDRQGNIAENRTEKLAGHG